MPLNMFTNASTCDPLSEQFEEINGPMFPWRPGRREPGKRTPAPRPPTADPGIRYLGALTTGPGPDDVCLLCAMPTSILAFWSGSILDNPLESVRQSPAEPL